MKNGLFGLRRDLVGILVGAALLLSVLAPINLRGQAGYGDILGRVSDNSGAVVPGATVTVRNEATNVSNTVVSTGSGDYTFTNLIPGTYQVTVTQKGFNQFVVNHISLLVGQTVREDAELTVGASTTTVNVDAVAPLVQTDTSEVGSVITSKEIEMIPLDGRSNIFGLIALAPGVQGGAWGNYTPKFAGNTVEGMYNVRLDGSDAQESENQYIGVGWPSLDSIAEFKVVDSLGSAQYGQGQSSVIAVTKSGTNQIHGSAFEYNRIAALAAQNFFATSQPKSPYVRNEFGGSVGGPIKRDKLFFFGSYEGMTFRSNSVQVASVPTAALLQGNFSGLPTIYDPTTCHFVGETEECTPFAGNVIPATGNNSESISPVAKNLFKYFEAPNQQGSGLLGLANNWSGVSAGKQDEFRYQGRIDYTINSTNQLSGTYFDANYSPSYGSGSTPTNGGVYFPRRWDNVAINYTHTFTPSMTNLFSFGYHRVWDKVYSQNATVDPATLVPGTPGYVTGLGGVPGIWLTNFTSLYDTGGGGDNERTIEFSDHLTWVKGKHTVQAGFSWMHWGFYNYQAPGNGNFTFSGRYAAGPTTAGLGSDFADFLLGDISSNNIGSAAFGATPLQERFGFYVQDQWKATSKLTATLGLRYDLPTLATNSTGNMANWYADKPNEVVVLKDTGNSTPNLFPGVNFVSGASVGLNAHNYIGGDHTQFSPRIGLAYRPLGNSHLVLRGGYGLYYASIPWVFQSFVLAQNPPFAASEFFEPADGPVPTYTFADPYPAANANNPGGNAPGLYAMPKHYRYPSTHQWNLTAESQISPNTSIRISYLGSEAEHNTSQIWTFNDPYVPVPGNVQEHRPYQPFGQIIYFSNMATSSTNQLQVSAMHRVSSGLSFQGTFSWTKMLDNGGFPAGNGTNITTIQNYRLDRGNDPFVRPLYFIGDYTYELPFGKGHRFLGSSSRALDLVVGGWQTSGIVTIGSGTPYSVYFDSPLQGWPSGRADKVGDPSVSNPSLTQWFNPAAFAYPAEYKFGNSAPYSQFGPHYFNWDSGFFKDFKLNERFKLTFRSDLMNILNHPNFGNPNNDISAVNVGTITGATNGRVVQFALRLTF